MLDGVLVPQLCPGASFPPSTSSFSIIVTTILGQHREQCASATVILPLLLSYMSFPQHTLVLHWESCWYTVSIFHQNLTLDNTVTILLSLSYLDKKLDIRVSVLTVSGHDACFWLSPWFFSFFFKLRSFAFPWRSTSSRKRWKISEIVLSPLTVIPDTLRSSFGF